VDDCAEEKGLEACLLRVWAAKGFGLAATPNGEDAAVEADEDPSGVRLVVGPGGLADPKP
jgi:hypothetical protein